MKEASVITIYYSSEVENPTPAGSSKYKTLAFLFHDLSLSTNVDLPGGKMKGPF